MSQRFIDIANFDYNRSPTHKNTRAKAVSMLHRGVTSLNPTFLAQSEIFEEPSSPFSPNFHLNPKQASGKLVQIPLEKMEFEEVQSFKATHRQMSINREIPKNSSQNLDKYKSSLFKNQSAIPLDSSSLKINIEKEEISEESSQTNSSKKKPSRKDLSDKESIVEESSPLPMRHKKESKMKSFSRLYSYREDLGLVNKKTTNMFNDAPPTPLLEESETEFDEKSIVISPNQTRDFTKKRSNSMFASFQNLLKKDEENIRLLLPLDIDKDSNLPIANAVLELRLEYMETFKKTNMKKLVRRKSCCCNFCGKMKKKHIGEDIILEQDFLKAKILNSMTQKEMSAIKKIFPERKQRLEFTKKIISGIIPLPQIKKLSETDKQIFASLRKRNKSNLLNVGTSKNHDEKLKKPKRRKSKSKPPIDLCKTLGLGFFGISKNSVKSPKDGLAKKESDKNSTVRKDMQLYLKKAMQPYKIKRTVLNHKMLEPKLHPESLFPSTKIRKNVLTNRLAYSSKLGERGKSCEPISQNDLPSLAASNRQLSTSKKLVKKHLKKLKVEKMKKICLYDKRFQNSHTARISTSPATSRLTALKHKPKHSRKIGKSIPKTIKLLASSRRPKNVKK
ncbi:unnamed protein product [Moneuplotes crassus]|uniref:Uncharacterized protein n=1 Tax=Euplotes crassus TaxID=5936 RepID=A0AAD1Y6C3_EUPCR|nr:unnamed protein product [Moneuplotes crassus]